MWVGGARRQSSSRGWVSTNPGQQVQQQGLAAPATQRPGGRRSGQLPQACVPRQSPDLTLTVMAELPCIPSPSIQSIPIHPIRPPTHPPSTPPPDTPAIVPTLPNTLPVPATTITHTTHYTDLQQWANPTATAVPTSRNGSGRPPTNPRRKPRPSPNPNLRRTRQPQQQQQQPQPLLLPHWNKLASSSKTPTSRKRHPSARPSSSRARESPRATSTSYYHKTPSSTLRLSPRPTLPLL